MSHAHHDLFSVVRKYFEDDRIRTLFTSYMHVVTTENQPGSGIVFPAILANVMSFGLPVGGAVTFPMALERVVKAGGGVVMYDANVQEIVTNSNRVTGVRLANDDIIESKNFVASAVYAPSTLHIVG